MNPRLADPPLDPSPGEARSGLRRELLKPEYHEEELAERVLSWLERHLTGALEAASQAPPLSTLLAMLLLALLVAGVGWLGSRARRTPSASGRARAVLGDGAVSAAELRARAEAALAAGRADEAVVEGFRALAARQAEHGRLEDRPGATAREVALALAEAYPHQRAPVERAAVLFDAVRYGARPATAPQARAVLALDDELVGVR